MDIDVDVEQHWSDDERMDEDMGDSGPSNPAGSEVQMDHSDGPSHGGGDGDDEMMGDAPASGSGIGDIEVDMDAPTPKPAAPAPPQSQPQPVTTLPSGFASAFVPPVSPEKAGHSGSPQTPELEMRAATPGPSVEGGADASAVAGVAAAAGSSSGGGDATALAPPATTTGTATFPELEMRPASSPHPTVPVPAVPATANPDASGVEVGSALTAGPDETGASGDPLTEETAAGVAGEAEGSSAGVGASADYFSSGLPPASTDVTDVAEAAETNPEEMPAQPSPKRSRSRSRQPTPALSAGADDAEGPRSEMGEHTDAEYDEGDEFYDGDFFITPASLPPIIVHLPALSRHSPAPAPAADSSSAITPALGRALFSPIESDPQQLPVWLKGRQLELAEASLLDVWSAIRAECAKEGLIPSAGEGMIITEQDMGLRMSEDDVNLQSITFIELLQLHQGCELPEPVQLHLTWESGRFITRFNAIQSELEAVHSRSTSEEMEVQGDHAHTDDGEGEEDGEGYEEDYVEDYEYIGHEEGEAEAEAEEDDAAEKLRADRRVSRERDSPKRDHHDEKAPYAECRDEAKTTKDIEREHPNWADARAKPTEELHYRGTENKQHLTAGSESPAAASEVSVPAPAPVPAAALISPARDEKEEPAGGAEGAEGASVADDYEHAAEYADDDEGEEEEGEEGEGEYDDDEREEDDNGEGHEYGDEGGEWAGDADTNDDPDPTAEYDTNMTHPEPPRLVAVLPKKDADTLLSAPTSAASPSASATHSLALPVNTDPKDEIALKHASLGSVLAHDRFATPLVSPGISAVGSPAPGSTVSAVGGGGAVPPPAASGAVTPLLSTEPELDSATITLTPSEDAAARALAEDALAFEKPSVIPEEASEEVIDDVPVPGGIPLDEIELKLQDEADAAVIEAGEGPALAAVAGVGGGLVPERELGEVGLVGSQDNDELETPAGADDSALDADTADYSYEEYDEAVGVTVDADADGDGEEDEGYGSTEETLDDDEEGKAFGDAEDAETTTGLGTDTAGGLTSFGDEATTDPEAERDLDAVTTVSKRSYDSDGDDGEGSKRARTG